MKHIITIIAALIISAAVQAEEPTASFFIGAGAATYEAAGEREGATSASVGIAAERVQLELTHAQIDTDLADSFDQTTLRIVTTIASFGPNSLTMQAGYSHGEIEALGETFSDGYGTFGLGYQLKIGKHFALRYMVNKYFVDEFGTTGMDLESPVENSLSAVVVF